MPKGYSVRHESDKVITRLYDTDIVKVDLNDRDITLNTGGWETKHTKNCMNRAMHGYEWRLYQKDFVWYLNNTDTGEIRIFVDGMKIAI